MADFVITFLAALAAVILWDFIRHFGEFRRGFRSGWGKSRLPTGPKPGPVSVTVNHIVEGRRLSRPVAGLVGDGPTKADCTDYFQSGH